MTAPFNVAVIGYGLGGRVFHAPFIAATEGLRLAAIVSSRKEEIAKRYPDVKILADPQAIFDDPAIDVVVISTPNDSHASLAARALDAGKHVVIDKPFAETPAEALALMQRAKGRLLTVFHNRRWDSDFLTLKRLTENGALGEIAYIESHFDLYRPVVRQRWREMPGPSSGIWYDLGSHLIDQVLCLLGMPDAIAADLAILRPGGVTVDYFRVLLRYGKRRIVLAGSYLAQGDLRWLVHGSDASYIKYGRDPQEPILAGGGVIGEVEISDAKPGYLVSPDGKRNLPPAIPGDYGEFYRNLRDCLQGVAPLAVSARQAFAVMEILALAEQSANEGRELAVTADLFP